MVALADAIREDNLSGFFAKVLEELSDLVSVHAGSWNFDRSCPVEIVVAEVESQLFKHSLGDCGIIISDVEVSREHATLGSSLRNEVEVILRLRVFVLNDLSIDETS